MRALASLATGVALAATAAATHADPALPAGWIAGGPASRMVSEVAASPRSREALQLAARPLTPAIEPVPIALDAIERVEVAPTLTPSEASSSKGVTSGAVASELFVDRGCGRVSVSGHAVGMVQLGWMGERIGPGASHGVDTYHVRGSTGGGNGKDRYALALWETLDRLPDGTIRYTQTAARFDIRTCKATVASAYTVVARPILGNLGYAFRTHCAACSPRGREELHLILPPAEWERADYAHVTLQLGDDGGAAARRQMDAVRLERFAKAFERPAPTVPKGHEVLIGVEAVRGIGESAPSVIGYAALVKHGAF